MLAEGGEQRSTANIGEHRARGRKTLPRKLETELERGEGETLAIIVIYDSVADKVKRGEFV